MYPTFRNIPFKNNLSLDVYKPKGNTDPVPALIYIHGGCWKLGTKNMLRAWADRFVNDLGVAVVTFDYRLSVDAPWPAQGEDVLDAIRWVKKAGGVVGIDTDKVGCFGESSGAHLCLYMATAGAADWETRPNVAVSMFGHTCFLCNGYTDTLPMPYGGFTNNHTIFSDELFGFSNGTLWHLKQQELNPDASKNIELVQSAEPLYQLLHTSIPSGNTPSIFIGQGEVDDEVSPSVAKYFADELEKHSVKHKLFLVPEGGHSYENWTDSDIEHAIAFAYKNIGE